MKKILTLILILIILSSFFVAFDILASKFQEGLTGAAGTATLYDQPKALESYATGIVKGLLTLVGVIFMALLIYGGFLYMTSAGNEEKVKKGKNTIIASVIGLLIIISGYSITLFITSQIESPGQTSKPAFRNECEDSRDPDYYSINCCEYRLLQFGSAEPNCCSQSSFCQSHFSECGKTSAAECP